jgi:sigma-E factor negative regulatory protein RseB
MRKAHVVVWAMLLSPLAQAAEGQARVWIDRMNEALSTRNYDGVFSHQVGTRREVMRIIHRRQGDVMAERLLATDGSGREFVRNGTEWTAYYPDRRFAIVETRNRNYGFISTLKGLSEESARYYAIRDMGSKRQNGVMTQVIHVEPRDGLRYGYRFWLDQSTAMPLRTQLISQAGEIVEEIAFISLSMPTSISDDMLKPDVDTTGFRWLRRGVAGAPNTTAVAFAPRVDLMPPGFRVRTFDAPGVAAAQAKSRFIISDGIAWVSVFIESAAAKPQVPGSRGSAVGNVVQMGSSAAYSAEVSGYRVTVVGEVPGATVKSIAEAVRPQ